MRGWPSPPDGTDAGPSDVVSPELRRYVADAVHCPTLLAAQLAPVGRRALQERLGCGEAAALRLLMCEAPTVAAWDRDVALIADCAGVDPRRLERLLRRVGVGDRTDWSRLLDRRWDPRRVAR